MYLTAVVLSGGASAQEVWSSGKQHVGPVRHLYPE
jgi:hypothetical protein